MAIAQVLLVLVLAAAPPPFAQAAPPARDVTLTAARRHATEGHLLRGRAARPRGAPAAHVQHDAEVVGAAGAAARSRGHSRARGRLSRVRRERRRLRRHIGGAGRPAHHHGQVAGRYRQGLRVPPRPAGREQGARRRRRGKLRREPGGAVRPAASRSQFARAARRRARPGGHHLPHGNAMAAHLCRCRSRRPVRRQRARQHAICPGVVGESPEQILGLQGRQARHRDLRPASGAAEADGRLVCGHARHPPRRSQGSGGGERHTAAESSGGRR